MSLPYKVGRPAIDEDNAITTVATESIYVSLRALARARNRDRRRNPRRRSPVAGRPVGRTVSSDSRRIESGSLEPVARSVGRSGAINRGLRPRSSITFASHSPITIHRAARY